MAALDRHDLYELCVQTPGERADLLAAIHGASPRVLGEDFAGTAATSRAWVRDASDRRAIAVDHDPVVTRRGETPPGVQIVEGDVCRTTDAARHAADVIYAGNFSIGEWHTRSDLLAYLRHVRGRLRRGGVFVCDVYGGETAFLTGATDRDTPLPDGRIVRYTWEQRSADPATGEVVNTMHFRILRDGTAETQTELTLTDAFVYHWRLWGIAELRDAMAEAGFSQTAVHHAQPDAIDDAGGVYSRPLDGPDELDDSFVVLVVGRTE